MKKNLAIAGCGALALALLSPACSDSAIAPSGPAPVETAPPPPTPVTCTAEFPAVSPPARIYAGTRCPSSAIHGSPLVSRYVIFDDGSFSLQYSSTNHPFFEFRGTYSETDGNVVFEWKANDPWRATGVLTDKSLTVSYNIDMQLSDFVDEVYLRVQ